MNIVCTEMVLDVKRKMEGWVDIIGMYLMGSNIAGLMDFVLNNRRIQLPQCGPQTTLLEWLRSNGLTGSKEGCAEGECGACTVLLVRPHATGSKYVPVNSCLLFLPTLAGQEVLTIEALNEKKQLAEAQFAMAEAGGSQCGYCTPGFVMSLFAEQYRPGRAGPCDPHAMGGNLCRCTGYRPIRDAALSLGPAPDDSFRGRLDLPAPSMIPVSYTSIEGRLERPGNLAQCSTFLEKYPDAKILAGATDLAVESNLAYKRWPVLMSIDAVAELQVFQDAPDHVEIGAGLPLSEIELLWEQAPLAAREWFPLFASILIRNRATLGGNLGTASPIGDAAPLLLALDAELKLGGANGIRRVKLQDFFLGYRKTQLEPGELIASIIIPKPFPNQARFYKVAKRRMDDISTVAACFALNFDPDGRIAQARVAYGGVAAVPIRVTEAEQSLLGKRWDELAVQQAQAIIASELEPLSDHRGSAVYRLAMAQTLLKKFWCER